MPYYGHYIKKLGHNNYFCGFGENFKKRCKKTLKQDRILSFSTLNALLQLQNLQFSNYQPFTI